MQLIDSPTHIKDEVNTFRDLSISHCDMIQSHCVLEGFLEAFGLAIEKVVVVGL